MDVSDLKKRHFFFLLFSFSITFQLWKISVVQRPRPDIKLSFLLRNFIRKMVITHRNTVLEKPPGYDWRKTTSQNFPKWLMTELSHLGCFNTGNCSEWHCLWLQPVGHQVGFCLVTDSARDLVLCMLRFLCFFNQVVSWIPSGRVVLLPCLQGILHPLSLCQFLLKGRFCLVSWWLC